MAQFPDIEDNDQYPSPYAKTQLDSLVKKKDSEFYLPPPTDDLANYRSMTVEKENKAISLSKVIEDFDNEFEDYKVGWYLVDNPNSAGVMSASEWSRGRYQLEKLYNSGEVSEFVYSEILENKRKGSLLHNPEKDTDEAFALMYADTQPLFQNAVNATVDPGFNADEWLAQKGPIPKEMSLALKRGDITLKNKATSEQLFRHYMDYKYSQETIDKAGLGNAAFYGIKHYMRNKNNIGLMITTIMLGGTTGVAAKIAEWSPKLSMLLVRMGVYGTEAAAEAGIAEYMRKEGAGVEGTVTQDVIGGFVGAAGFTGVAGLAGKAWRKRFRGEDLNRSETFVLKELDEATGNQTSEGASLGYGTSHTTYSLDYRDEVLEELIGDNVHPTATIADLTEIAEETAAVQFKAMDATAPSTATPRNLSTLYNPSPVEALYGLGVKSIYELLDKIIPSRLTMVDGLGNIVVQAGKTTSSVRAKLNGHYSTWESKTMEILDSVTDIPSFKSAYDLHVIRSNAEIELKNAKILEIEKIIAKNPSSANSARLKEIVESLKNETLEVISDDVNINKILEVTRTYYKKMEAARVDSLLASSSKPVRIVSKSIKDSGYAPLSWVVEKFQKLDLTDANLQIHSSLTIIVGRLKHAYLNSPQMIAMKEFNNPKYQKLLATANKDIFHHIKKLKESQNLKADPEYGGFTSSKDKSRVLPFNREMLGDLVETDNLEGVTKYAFEMSSKISAREVLGISDRKEFKLKYEQKILDEIRGKWSLSKRQLVRDKLERVIDDTFGKGRSADNPDSLIQQTKRFTIGLQVARWGANFGLVQAAEIPQAIKISPNLPAFVSNMAAGIKRTISEYRKTTGRSTTNEDLFDFFQSMGLGASIHNAMAATSRYGISSELAQHTSAPVRTIEWLGNKVLHWSGMMGLLQSTRHAAVLGFVQRALEISKRATPLTKSEIKYFARQGIDKKMLDKISKQPWSKVKGVWEFDFTKWDPEVLDRFMDSVNRGTKEAILDPQALDLPKFMTDPNNIAGSLASIFLRFPVAAYNSILRAGIADRDARTLIAWTQSLMITAAVLKGKDELSAQIWGTEQKYKNDNRRLVLESAARLPAASISDKIFRLIRDVVRFDTLGVVNNLGGSGLEAFVSLWKSIADAFDGDTSSAVGRVSPLLKEPVKALDVSDNEGVPAIANAMNSLSSAVSDTNSSISDGFTAVGKDILDSFVGEAHAGEAATEQWHVQEGDTLTSIARTLGTSVPALLKANPDIKDPNKISVGQKLNMYGSNMIEGPSSSSHFSIDANPLTEVGTSGVVPDVTDVSNVGSHSPGEQDTVQTAYEMAKNNTLWDGGTTAGQTALGVSANGNVGDDTRKAFVKLFTTDNLASILTAEGGDGVVEGVLHRGAEIDRTLNPNLQQTTRYGVVVPHTYKKMENGNEVSITVRGFAKRANESDKDHATRYYNIKVIPKLKVVIGIEQESSEVVDALAKYIWNKGSLPSSFALDDQVASQNGMLDITTSDGLQLNGVVNRTLKEYDAIAKAKGWERVTKIRTVRDPNDSNKFKVQYYNAQGLVHDDGEYKGRNGDSHSHYIADREFDVNSNNDIVIASSRVIPNP